MHTESLLVRYLVALLSWSAVSSSRHIHNVQHHRHYPRQAVEVAVTSTTTSTLPAVTAGDATISDIQNIQQGRSDLPRDLLKFVKGVEDRLEEIEDVLEGLVASTPRETATSIHSELPAESTPTSKPVIGIGASSLPAVTTTSSTRRSPFVPIPGTETSSVDHTTITRTIHVLTTRTRTIADQASVSASGPVFYSANSTINGTLSTPASSEPYASGGIAITYTVSLPLTGSFTTTLSRGSERTRSTLVTTASAGRLHYNV